MKQIFTPARHVFCVGDVLHVRLEAPECGAGKAFFRTTLNRAEVLRHEVIDSVERGVTPGGNAWHDIALEERAPGVFEKVMPLMQVGVFGGKCAFKREDGKIVWAPGNDFRIKVECAENAAPGALYAAFTRQFGGVHRRSESLLRAEKLLDEQGYTVIPPSGKFRDLMRQLDFIMGELGCRTLQLLPIHPAPALYGRMGRYGSPFAATDYFAVDPAFAEFDRRRSPLEQFDDLLDAVHARGGRLFLDLPVNHTGWASKLQNEHPECFVRRPDGEFESPGAWGVTWADLCKLDYGRREVRDYMAKVFLYWCRRGVDGFRCDAGYMVPADAWRYILACVRSEYPDTVFLLEGLGGKLSVQEQLLGEVGLDRAYSELFQEYSADSIRRYLPYVLRCADECGVLVNFAETHDNNRLAASGKAYAAMRCALSALASTGGEFGYANGVENLATEKIDVHGNGELNLDAADNLVTLLKRLSRLLCDHPAFASGSRVRLLDATDPDVVLLRREDATGRFVAVAAVNINTSRPAHAALPSEGEGSWVDLLGDSGGPAEDVCELAPGGFAVHGVPAHSIGGGERQKLRAMAQKIYMHCHPDASAPDQDSLAMMLRENVADFLTRTVTVHPAPVVRYRVGADARRVVMFVPEDVLCFTSEQPFSVELGFEGRVLSRTGSVPSGGLHVVLTTCPVSRDGISRDLTVRTATFIQGRAEHAQGAMRALAQRTMPELLLDQDTATVRKFGSYFFGANEHGSLSMARGAWSSLNSKYDALLAANLDRRIPVDRRTMFTRCRIWMVLDDFSSAVDIENLSSFSGGNRNSGHWRFDVPAGQGFVVPLEIDVTLDDAEDRVRLRFMRPAGSGSRHAPPDSLRIKLILRPDLEDRNNHECTHACNGPETAFRQAVRSDDHSFVFAPAPERALNMRMARGTFHREDEWRYMVDLPSEAYYGLEHHTDLFSPGYFEVELGGGDVADLVAAVNAPPEWRQPEKSPELIVRDFNLALSDSLRKFVVKRNEHKSVIAGYPWFLDWGRDTLIAVRGLIASGFGAESLDIIREFASFEQGGTIPNVIRGADGSNRDTSDAPLWMIVAARDYADQLDAGVLDADCKGRPLLAVLRSIADSYMRGTANGIGMDPASGLIFSPAHFTWMDTNYPAGTPREGYPIEIQALWIAALRFLGRFESRYLAAADQAARSLDEYFYLKREGRFSDCLHAGRGVGAARAEADDHVRCNQLFALTLRAVSERSRQQAILNSAAELLVPGAIRTLSDRPVRYRLEIRRDGNLLNDPGYPYRGRYCGPEDTERKVAYHNGTAWCWPFPSYCEALYLVGGEPARDRALALLASSEAYFSDGVALQLPEVADGDAPHHWGGCVAQAWSVSEFARVYHLLQKTVKVIQ